MHDPFSSFREKYFDFFELLEWVENILLGIKIKNFSLYVRRLLNFWGRV